MPYEVCIIFGKMAERKIVMIIVMKPGTQETEIREVSKVLETLGLGVHISKGAERTIHWRHRRQEAAERYTAGAYARR